uniref:Uncharacterized protein n=1 Tax=Hordeum vulgare subsp. vulgare TaxID=112509 RepID=A0A8I6X590_HORVV
MVSSGSSSFSPAIEEVDGVGIVQHSSEFYLPWESYSGLEFLSKNQCPGHGLVPARRVSWGGASSGRRFLGCPLDLPYECQWVVWVDPAPPLLVGLAFEDLHTEIESSWNKCHHLKKENIELARKNKALKKKLRERDEM